MSFYSYDTASDRTAMVYSKEELSTAIIDTIEYYQNKLEVLHKTNQRLIDDAKATVEEGYKKDIEILQERLNLAWGEFASQKELDAYNDFTRRHIHNRMESKANGGLAPYIIPNYTDIGCIKKVVCQICGESEDITDTEAW